MTSPAFDPCAFAAELGLTATEFDAITEGLGRIPNRTEIGIFAGMWSEHSSYKSTLGLLASLPRDGERVLAGPGSLAKGLGIHTRDSGVVLSGSRIWIEDHGVAVSANDVRVGPRVGIDYAGEDAALPYRFILDT